MSETSSTLKLRVDKHLAACAALAAAGVAGQAQQADAAIQYSGLLNIAVNPLTSAGIYVDVNGLSASTSSVTTPGFDINLFNATFTGGGRAFLGFLGNGANPVGTGSALTYVSKLASGTTVGPASTFIAGGTAFAYPLLAYIDPTNVYALPGTQWEGGVTDGFVGIRLAVSGQFHYGWLRLNIGPGASTPSYASTLVDFAWDDTPNTPIATGAGIPEPTSIGALAALAAGAAGIRSRRKVA